jgi:hypothetical protein
MRRQQRTSGKHLLDHRKGFKGGLYVCVRRKGGQVLQMRQMMRQQQRISREPVREEGCVASSQVGPRGLGFPGKGGGIHLEGWRVGAAVLEALWMWGELTRGSWSQANTGSKVVDAHVLTKFISPAAAVAAFAAAAAVGYSVPILACAQTCCARPHVRVGSCSCHSHALPHVCGPVCTPLWVIGTKPLSLLLAGL